MSCLSNGLLCMYMHARAHEKMTNPTEPKWVEWGGIRYYTDIKRAC
jgi:hypothetical protein